MSSLEDIFGKLALTTVTTVSRIALSHATNVAIRNVTSYVTTQLPKNKQESNEINFLQRQLDLKVKNLKPTIDIIAKGVAEGNQDVEPALEMCNDLKRDMDMFASQMDTLKEPEDVKRRLQKLLSTVDDVIPSLHLALRTIEHRSGKRTASVSRLVRASFVLEKQTTFSLKLYSLFTANQRDHSAAYAFTWKEEFHKCRLNVVRHQGWKHQLRIQEDLEDGLYHEEEEKPKELVIGINDVQRMYHTQSGDLLNLEDLSSSVLVLKVSKKEERKQESKVETKEATPEIIQEELRHASWYAFGLWEDDDEEEEKKETKDNLNLLTLESVIKLGLLETTEQISHLEASDELINLYMT
ncbi:hypothetical protein G6F46_005008 [Rhizopus delemar]|uniref:Ran-specific GTPase-activating protein 30 n=3 Tax=Rhizopus TaxID=4842 RepID=I1CJ18_RHIO9|nr:hypothetical protein RO3G_13159 [Rhizopus delemar RA 99-880]KAG1461336.1 hypothetical protein G6F55_003621 [Rhizopus delemar]KAG1546035.1 hypothetical protein G6F51_005116 [Rhizopus arrhizus]KAG1499571.1 hypothetical protein G6F54_004319 [Rhizopus delemar]KAG1513299.1 hypothetical protein G6F53_004535 [Rhizopus delemar]|eukprot:EIE88448.1 hypothetical protein RO3G_13159 [Rhizopus delemar RA 99-880]